MSVDLEMVEQFVSVLDHEPLAIVLHLGANNDALGEIVLHLGANNDALGEPLYPPADVTDVEGTE